MKRPKIVVLGAMFLDTIFVQVPKMPDVDESVYAFDHRQAFGGKGFNQAAAAAALGADVILIASIGDDIYRQPALQELEKHQLASSAVQVVYGASTPVCCVYLDESGRSRFIGSQRACYDAINREYIESRRQVFQGADILLVTFDYQCSALLKAIECAKEAGAFVICNPAPLVEPISDDALPVLKACDLVVPNKREAQRLLDIDDVREDADSQVLAGALEARGIKRVCVTDGERGSCLVGGDATIFQQAFPVSTNNTSGASDQFCGALSYYWSMMPPNQALLHATASVSIWLAQDDRTLLPGAAQVEEFLRAQAQPEP